MDLAELRSYDVADVVSGRVGLPLSAEAYRKRLHFARKKFAAFLAEQVASTLDDPMPEKLERELIGLNLFEYCRDTLPGSA